MLPSPFDEAHYRQALIKHMEAGVDTRQQWQHNAVEFSRKADLYSMPERAADIIEATATRRCTP